MFWVSWWDKPSGLPGKDLTEEQQGRFRTWIAGERGPVDAPTEYALCARVEAADDLEAWEMIETMYPGAKASEARHELSFDHDWWPDDKRFPKSLLVTS